MLFGNEFHFYSIIDQPPNVRKVSDARVVIVEDAVHAVGARLICASPVLLLLLVELDSLGADSEKCKCEFHC